MHARTKSITLIDQIFDMHWKKTYADALDLVLLHVDVVILVIPQTLYAQILFPVCWVRHTSCGLNEESLVYIATTL